MPYDSLDRSVMGVTDDGLLPALRDWETKLQDRFLRASKLEGSKRIVKSKSLNMKEMLDALPPVERKRFMADYSRIIGFNKLMDTGKPWGTTVMDAAGDSNELRKFLVDPSKVRGKDASVLETIYNRLFVQVDPLAKADDPARFTFGGNILRADYLEELVKNNRHIAPGSTSAAGFTGRNVVVFDTETAGILEESGVRQVSASKMAFDPGSGTFSAPEKIFDRHFKTSRMSMGMVAHEGKAETNMLAHFQKRGWDYANKVAFEGSDFVGALRPFLEQLRDADHVVGHNVQFDINQIFVGLQNTGAYKEDTDGFKSFLDDVMGNTLVDGKVKDTLEMSRAYLPHLKPAEEILATGKASSHSIENLLLQTNLAELIRNDVGSDDGFKKVFGMGSKSLHSSDIDTSVTGYLLKFIGSGQLAEGQLDKIDPLYSTLRRSVLSSWAPTPVSNIADIGSIDKRMFSALIGEANLDPDNAYLSAARNHLGRGHVDRMIAGGGDELYDAMADLHSKIEVPLSLKVNPLEQEMYLTRKTVDNIAEKVTDADLVSSIGNWRQFAGQGQPHSGMLNKFSTLFKKGVRPSDESFLELQQKLATHGVPFSGLSMPERWFTGAMAMAVPSDTGGEVYNAMSGAEQKVAHLGEDLGVSRFGKAKHAYVSESKRNITLPMDIIEQAEEAGILAKTSISGGDDVAMLGYSAYKSDAGGKRVALNYMLEGSEEEKVTQAEKLGRWIEEKMADPSSMVGDIDFKSFFRTNSVAVEDVQEALLRAPKTGIQIGSLDGRAGTVAYDMVESFQQGILTDRGKINMRAGYLAAGNGQSEDVIRTGAWHLDRFGDKTWGDFYKRDLGVLSSRVGALEETVAGNSRLANEMLFIASGSDRSLVTKAVEGYEKFRGAAPKAAAVAAIAGIGLMAYKHHKANEVYDQTLEAQPQESGSKPGYITDDMLNYGQNNMDPLATAGTIRELRDRRTGHSKMGPNKYSDLYGGR